MLDPTPVHSQVVQSKRTEYDGHRIHHQKLGNPTCIKLVEVAHFISGLNPNRRNERIAALNATAGSMPGEEGEAFEKAVREEADRIDAAAWK
jgi:hypothetical protein